MITSAVATAISACSPVSRRVDPARVDEQELPAVPFGVAVYAVARDAGGILDYRSALAYEPVEKSAFSYVRPSYYSR